MTDVAAANEEAKQAWDGPLFDRYVTFRELIVDGTLPHAREAHRLEPPRPGDRALDLGCGFGDTTRMLADLVGPEGSAVGVDVSPRFIEAAAAEADEAGAQNVEYRTGDAQVMDLPGPFDFAFSMIGIMFFASPVQAFRNIREAMAPGGRLCAVVWRRKLDNDWLHRAEQVVDDYLDEPEPDETDEPTCGPGPFSMANADTVTEQLQIAGWEEVSLRRCDVPIKIGNDLDHAVSFNLAIGPAGELVRLSGDRADEVRPVIEERLRDALADLEGPDGVIAPASTWIISARSPL